MTLSAIFWLILEWWCDQVGPSDLIDSTLLPLVHIKRLLSGLAQKLCKTILKFLSSNSTIYTN